MFASIAIIAIFSLSIFLSAALMFVIEPMVAKMFLPLLGGSGNVWNTCVFFFQCVLLLGYLYAHFLNTSKLTPAKRALIHVIIIWLPLLSLPMHPPAQTPSEDAPYLWLLATLVSIVGGVFFALSTSAPLLQKWYASTNSPGSKDPYFLYAASNLGSLLGLLSYPFVIEPSIGFLKQSDLLFQFYCAFALLISACTIYFALKSESNKDEKFTDSDSETLPPEKKQYGIWLYLSMLPSSLVLGLTTYVTGELGGFPLFWLIPLSLYILSFVVAFSRLPERFITIMSYLAIVLIVCVLISLSLVTMPPSEAHAAFAQIGLSLQLPTLFIVSLVCHGKVAQSRPSTRYLTNYYLCIALGGILGTSINTFAAPFLFNEFLEYPLMLTLAATTFVCMFKIGKFEIPTRVAPWVVLCSLLGVFCYHAWSSDARVVYAKRNFYGQVRIKVDLDNNLCKIMDGVTLHGGQSLDPQERILPLFYYNEDGPIWTLLKTLTHTVGLKKCGVLGMGAGTMAAYAAPGHSMTFFELNPLVIDLASNPFYFTYIYDAMKRKAHIEIIEGDGRLNISKEANKQFSLLLIDAYSSDNMPLHLMTREAIKLYHSKLVDGGAIAFNITSNYFDAKEILSKGAHSLNLEAVSLDDYERNDDSADAALTAWVVITGNHDLVQRLKEDYKWKEIPYQEDTRIWTDDYCDLLSALLRGFQNSESTDDTPESEQLKDTQVH